MHNCSSTPDFLPVNSFFTIESLNPNIRALSTSPRALSTSPTKLPSIQEEITTTKNISHNIIVAGAATALGLLSLNATENPEDKIYIKLHHMSLFLGAAKVCLFALKEQWNKFSETENQKLQTLFTGVLTGVMLTTLDIPQNDLSDMTKKTLEIAMLGVAIISSMSFAYIDASGFDTDPEEAKRLDKINIQTMGSLAMKTAAIAIITRIATFYTMKAFY